MRDEANAAFYDGDSRSYDETRWVSDAGIFTDTAQQEIVADLTNAWSEVKILEAGPGTARFTIPLARKANRISLVDISSGMLETAQENLAKEGLETAIVEARQGSLYELPFADGQFDRAICLNVLSHIENSALALKELSRVVRPGGEVLINYPNLQSYYWPAARRINDRAKAVDVDVYSIWDTPKENASAAGIGEPWFDPSARSRSRPAITGAISSVAGRSNPRPNFSTRLVKPICTHPLLSLSEGRIEATDTDPTACS